VLAPKRLCRFSLPFLAFLWLAFDPATKRFRNCLSYERQWQEAEGSEDSHGRAVWGLGTVLGRSKDLGLRGAAGRMFELAVPAALEFKSPRACAFALLGLLEYLDSFLETAPLSVLPMLWRIDCWIPTARTALMIGSGLRAGSPIRTPVCPRLWCDLVYTLETKKWFRPASKPWIGWSPCSVAK